MTEREYIHATNLKTARILLRILEELLPDGEILTVRDVREWTDGLRRLATRLEGEVQTE